MSPRIAIIGMGASGQAAAQLALKNGADVLCIDSRSTAPIIPNTVQQYGTDPSDLLCEQHRIVLSPGVPLAHPMLQKAKDKGIPIISELGFAAEHIDIPMLAITGTNGKSSTTWFTAQFLEQAGKRAFVGGNFGTALSALALDTKNHDIAVVEVSSYQMEAPGKFCPHAAVALNLTPDHLARHKTMESYAEHKRRIFSHQSASQWAIAPFADPRLHPQSNAQKLWLGGTPGAVATNNGITIKNTPNDGFFSLQGSTLYGAHNIQNLMASLLLCSTVGISPSSLDVTSVQPLAHRLELILNKDGIRWINDSKATNVEATIAGIAGAPAPQILLLGGAGKEGADYTQLQSLITEHVRTVICFGAERDIIHSQLPHSHCCPSLDEATALARTLAQKGDTILLSPACASFDAFANFVERGKHFTQLVRGFEV